MGLLKRHYLAEQLAARDDDEACAVCGDAGTACERCEHVLCLACLADEGDCPVCVLEGETCPLCMIRLDEEAPHA